MFVTKRVFDPALVGKAVHINGHCVDGDAWDEVVLVKGVDGEYIQLMDRLGRDRMLHMENFETGDLLKMQLLALPQPPRPIREPIEKLPRKAQMRNTRPAHQRKKENAEVERILQENIEPMRLDAILREMRKRGYLHWNNNNASGHVKHAINAGMNIRKEQTGVYSYNWEGQR